MHLALNCIFSRRLAGGSGAYAGLVQFSFTKRVETQNECLGEEMCRVVFVGHCRSFAAGRCGFVFCPLPRLWRGTLRFSWRAQRALAGASAPVPPIGGFLERNPPNPQELFRRFARA